MMMKLLSTILRVIFGAVFMFSGFVKAVDPWGTAYKIEEYLSAFSMGWLSDKISFLPVTVSVILCCAKACGCGVHGFLHYLDIYRRFDQQGERLRLLRRCGETDELGDVLEEYSVGFGFGRNLSFRKEDEFCELTD